MKIKNEIVKEVERFRLEEEEEEQKNIFNEKKTFSEELKQ